MAKVIDLWAYRTRRNRDVLIRIALRTLAETGLVALTDLQIAEKVWKESRALEGLYVLHGDGQTWIVEQVFGEGVVS